jgi:hypothetical protein
VSGGLAAIPALPPPPPPPPPPPQAARTLAAETSTKPFNKSFETDISIPYSEKFRMINPIYSRREIRTRKSAGTADISRD